MTLKTIFLFLIDRFFHEFLAGVLGRLSWNGHLSTLTASLDPMGKQGRVLHPFQNRVLSVSFFQLLFLLFFYDGNRKIRHLQGLTIYLYLFRIFTQYIAFPVYQQKPIHTKIPQ